MVFYHLEVRYREDKSRVIPEVRRERTKGNSDCAQGKKSSPQEWLNQPGPEEAARNPSVEIYKPKQAKALKL